VSAPTSDGRGPEVLLRYSFFMFVLIPKVFLRLRLSIWDSERYKIRTRHETVKIQVGTEVSQHETLHCVQGWTVSVSLNMRLCTRRMGVES
jgi:hypothetical protein